MASANNTLIGAIRAEATLEGGKFVSGAKKIQQSAKQTETQFKKSFGAMGAAVKGFGAALASGLTIGLLSTAIKKALDYAGSLQEVAQQLGVTAKDLQVFRFAAGQVGVKQEQLETGLSKLTITLGKVAAGAKAPTEALRAIGVSADQLRGKDTGEAFRIIADGLQKVTDRSQRAAVEVALFGKSGAMLDNLLAGGSAALNELSAAAEKLGIILSDEQIQKADETADKLEALKTILSAQIAGVVANNAQAILELANSLIYLVSAAAQAAAKMAAFYRSIAIQGARFVRDHPDVSRIAFGTKGSEKILRAGAGAIRSNIADRAPPKPGLPRPSGGADVGQFLAPKGGGGRSRRAPRAPRDRSDDVSFQFDQELQRAHMDVLRAQQSLAKTSSQRAAIALQLLDAERQMQQAELDDRVRRAERDLAEGKITAGTLAEVKAQAESLKAEYDKADALQRQAITEELAAEKARDAVELDQSARDLKIEQLQVEASLAETAAEKRDVELRILAAMKEQERARLKAVIADGQASDLAKAEAQLRLDNLDAIYAGRADVVKQGTRGPYEDWMSSLPTSAEKMQEAFERLEVQGFDGLIDAALALTDGFDSAKEALLNTLKQFLLGLAKAQLQSALGNLLPKGGFTLPGFAGGGSFTVGGLRGVDRNTLMLNGIPIANVSYGERVSVSNDNGRSSGMDARGGVTVNVNGVRDFDTFRRNSQQVRRTTRRALGV